MFFTNIPAGGATIVYSLTSPTVSISATQKSGDGEISNPSPVADQTFSVAVGGSTTVTTNVPAGNATFNTKIELSNLTGGGQPDFRFITYSVKCTPVSQPAKLKIAKKTVGGTGTFQFSSSGPSAITNFSLTTVAENTAVTSSQFSNLTAGSYTFTETMPSSNWQLTDVSCTGTGATVGTVSASGQAQITLAQGADATCTFTNTLKGSITITKSTVGGNGTFGFTGSGPTSISAFNLTTPGSATTTLTGLSPGNYSITENDPTGAGFNLTSLTCTDPTNNTTTNLGTRTASINLAAGENVSCTFTNTKRASITITKNTTGGDGTFGFTSTIPGQANFNLTTSGGTASTTFSNVTPGSYTVTESSLSGFVFSNLQCTGDNNGSVDLAARKATINLDAGESVTCTFSNAKTGSITITKATVGGNGTFGFTGSGPTSIAAFNLTTPGSATTTLTGLAPGSYTISENDPSGSNFKLTGLTCSDPTNNSSTNVGTRTATVSLGAGESVSCTFTNTKNGSITVKKVTIGGDDTFTFGVTGQPSFPLKNGQEKQFASLTPGTYTIEETNLPSGWILQSATCGQGTKVGNAITVDLDPGESITCTFTNFKEKDDRMEDVTKLFIHRRVDNLLTHGPDRARMLRRLEGPPQEASIKDGPLKLQGGPSQLGMGGGATGTAGSGLSVAASGLGVTGFNLGSPISRAEGPYVGPNGTGMVGAGRSDDPDSTFDQPLQTSRMSGFGAAAFNQIGNAASGGLSQGFKFSASLSELRATLQAVEEAKAEEKARAAQELGFGGQPYTRPITNMRQGFDFWVEGQMSRYDDGTGGINREGDFKILYVGADYTLSSRVLVGTLVQFDMTNEKVKNPDLTGSVDGRGWMAGPYMGIKLTDNIIFDARAAWGTSSNDIMLDDPLAGKRTGSFDTTRWLATATLTGNWFNGPWRLTPQVGVAYGHEEYDTYKNSLGQTVDGASVSIGRATFGTEVGYRIIASDGTLVEPHIGITGIWNFNSDDLVINGAVVETNKSRAKVDGGIILRRPNGMGMRAAVSYDGIGQSNYEAWTGQLWLNFPLN